MAHPIRPEKYAAIDNFYTATVYNKGAEVRGGAGTIETKGAGEESGDKLRKNVVSIRRTTQPIFL